MLKAETRNDIRDWGIELLKGSKFCLISHNTDGVCRVGCNLGGRLSVCVQEGWDMGDTNEAVEKKRCQLIGQVSRSDSPECQFLPLQVVLRKTESLK